MVLSDLRLGSLLILMASLETLIVLNKCFQSTPDTLLYDQSPEATGKFIAEILKVQI